MSAAITPAIAAEAKPQPDTAVDAIREFARRWSRQMLVSADVVLSGERLACAEGRVRDQLFFVLNSLTRAQDELLGDAFGVNARTAMLGRRRFWERMRENPTLEAFAGLSVQAVNRDAAFFDRFSSLVSAEVEARRQRANRARADALYLTSQRPAFEISRRCGLTRHFDNGGREALADRARRRSWASTPNGNTSVDEKER